MAPQLSIVVVFFNMRREAPRTLYTLSRRHQRGVANIDYEVIAVDNGSTEPLDAATVEGFGEEFRYLNLPDASASPCTAVNVGAGEASGSNIAVCVDGARMASPGLVEYSLLATRLAQRPVVTTLAWHLGPADQRESMLSGYDQAVEDDLLDGVDWRADGYELFSISTPAPSSAEGWFRPLSESNCITVNRSTFEELGGFDERFRSPGGGLANHDYLKRALGLDGAQHVLVLGEGTFHQFHGGVATNVPRAEAPWPEFAREYEEIRGAPYVVPETEPILMGTVPDQLLPTAAEFVARALDPR